VAAQAKKMSARTGGLILWQILFDMVRTDRRVARLLDGPTSEVWIDPWVARLQKLGVRRNEARTRIGGQSDDRLVTVIRDASPRLRVAGDGNGSEMVWERIHRSRRLLSNWRATQRNALRYRLLHDILINCCQEVW
jgi:hypothetical protein